MEETYSKFLARKTQLGGEHGFAPIEIPDFLFPFQAHLVEWALRRGRAAIFADCGLGKTAMQLAWAENVLRHTGRPVIVLAPLAVAGQTVREAEKFGIEATHSRRGTVGRAITVTNYEQLQHYRPDDFAGVVCDESSILKNFDGKTKAAVTEFMRTRPYRLLCTATAAPNDYVELGTSSEAIGELGFADMITKFFRQETTKDHLGWGRTKYRLRGHAVDDFWRWVCSWSRACRKPSDLGFDDGNFVLPPLTCREHVIAARIRRKGFLFDLPAVTLEDQREERRRTIAERCERVAELVAHDRPAIVWTHLNDEGNLATKLIDGAVQVSGSDDDEAKEAAFLAFIRGDFRVLVSKPVIAGFGLNFQHCAHQTFFPSHSFEQFYQAVRRSWRFGQSRTVAIDVVASEGEAGVMASLQRKADAAEAMFSRLVELMHDHITIARGSEAETQEDLPPWLYSISA